MKRIVPLLLLIASFLRSRLLGGERCGWLLAWLVCCLVSCTGQNYTITIHNRSAFPIDSVAIPYTAFLNTEKINAHETKTITLQKPEPTDWGDGTIDIVLYTKGFKREVPMVFYWDGTVGIRDNQFYNSDNWLICNDTVLPKPQIFGLIISDETTDHTIDSIEIAKKAIISIDKGVPNYRYYHLHYGLFEKDPTITLYQKGMATKVAVKKDWNFWNTTSTRMYIYDNGEILYDTDYRAPKKKTVN